MGIDDFSILLQDIHDSEGLAAFSTSMEAEGDVSPAQSAGTTSEMSLESHGDHEDVSG